MVCDFRIRYVPAKDTQEDLIKKILYVLILKRLKHNKPAVTFVSADSGEGKSLCTIRLEQLLLEMQGLNIKDYLHDINVYTPLQYPQKLDRILTAKELKQVQFICMHEAREVIKSKRWQDFVTQAVADVNAMSRSIKKLGIFIISQFIRDITTDVRYTINYYIKVTRPLGKRARLYIYVVWKDDRDLEQPKLRKRKLKGYLVYPNGKHKEFSPKYLEMRLPDKDIVKEFEEKDKESKLHIVRGKLEKMIKSMEKETDSNQGRVKKTLDFYMNNPDSLKLIGKKRGNKWKLTPKAREMHDFTKEEAASFEHMLNEKLKGGE